MANGGEEIQRKCYDAVETARALDPNLKVRTWCLENGYNPSNYYRHRSSLKGKSYYVRKTKPATTSFTSAPTPAKPAYDRVVTERTAPTAVQPVMLIMGSVEQIRDFIAKQ